MRLDQAKKVLGLTSVGDLAVVRRRYHELARERHPDAGGDATAFLEVQTAYDLLLDLGPLDDVDAPDLRRAADRHGQAVGPAKPDFDLDDVDWDQPLPTSPTRATVASLALAAASSHPIAAVTARSRGPKTKMVAMTPHIEDSLTARLRLGVHVGDGEVGVQIATERRQLRKLLLDHHLPSGWLVTRPSSDLVVASRAVASSTYAQVTGLRLALVAAEALESLQWPMRTWMITLPLAPKPR